MTRRSHPIQRLSLAARRDLRRPVFNAAAAMLASACAVIAAAGCGTNVIDGVNPTGGSAVGQMRDQPALDGGVGTISCDDPSAARGATMGGFGPGAPVFQGTVAAADPPPPISGGTLIVLRDGVTAVAADPDRDRVYVVDLSQQASPVLRFSIALSAHDEPGRLVEDGAGLVHVALRRGGGLATIDTTRGEVALRRSVCSAPRGLAYDPAGDVLHVACAGGELLTFTPTAATPVRSLKLPQDLRDVVVDGPRLLVSRFRSAEVLVLDANGVTQQVIVPASLRNAAVHEGRSFAPAVAWRTVGMPGGGAVMIHQRGMNGTVATSSGGYGGFGPCDTIVHTAVTKVKSGERSVPGPAMPAFVLPVDVALSGDGKRVAMVAAGNGHTQFQGPRKLFVTNLDDASSEWTEGCGVDDKHGPASISSCPSGNTGGSMPNPDGTCPMGLQICLGQCIDASAICDTSVKTAPLEAAVDGGTGGATGTSGSSDGDVGVGRDSATGDANATDGPTGHCSADLPGPIEPVAVAFMSATDVVVQTREPAQLWVVSDVTGVRGVVTLSQESRADTGHAVFHSNSGGGLACASCHPEGHEDGRVWDFQCAGPRRTQDVSGGLIGTEPFHWEGDLPDFPRLVDTVFVGRMSGPSLTREQSMATLNWLNAVPSKTAIRATTDPSVQRGKEVFSTPGIGCFNCHAGAALTNNATVDVGTSASFQVPSLRGVGWRAPYMHDGCAATLSARFLNPFCGGGDSHGATSRLTPPQIDDLVAFLESL